jgi:hypothetical protein
MTREQAQKVSYEFKMAIQKIASQNGLIFNRDNVKGNLNNGTLTLKDIILVSKSK